MALSLYLSNVVLSCYFVCVLILMLSPAILLIRFAFRLARSANTCAMHGVLAARAWPGYAVVVGLERGEVNALRHSQ